MEKCYATKLCVSGAGLTESVGTREGQEAEGGRWRSLRSGCHLLEKGGLSGGKFPDARLWVLFEILESSRGGDIVRGELGSRPSSRGGGGSRRLPRPHLLCLPGPGCCPPEPHLFLAPHSGEPRVAGVGANARLTLEGCWGLRVAY